MKTHAHRAREWLADVVRDWGPPPLPVKFRTKDNLGEDFAQAYKVEEEFFLVFLERTMSVALAEFVIMHEIAHIYAWDAGAQYRDDHDATWGVAYARVWCSVKATH